MVPPSRSHGATSGSDKVARLAMKIGVAKEIKSDEYRVALTPAGARELADAGHDVLIEQGAGEGSAFPDDAYEAVGAQIVSVDDVWGDAELLLKVKEPIDGRVRTAARRARPLHVPAPRGGQGPDERARRERNLRGRVRDRRDEQPSVAAARADERDRGPARRTGRRLLPREAARRPRPAARRSARSRARPGRRHRRRDGRLQLRRHRARARRERDDHRALDRPHASPRGGAGRPRHTAHVVEPPDRGVGRAGGRRHRGRAHSGCGRAEARHPARWSPA